ncbi:hypothetical protein MRY82_09310 [bacterium]|nr:hypothetical protein [bacterium]
MHQNLFVVKLGESSLGKSKDLKRSLPKIIAFLHHLQKQNKKIILVVSALSGHSRKIKKIIENIAAVNLDSYNTLFCHAEFFSCNLIETYFNQHQLNSKALIFEKTPTQLLSKDNAREWEIEKINQEDISNCIKQNIIPIVPGFIGQSKQNNYQAMNFDCSDVTALHLTKLYNAQQCIFLKNPGALHICNPMIVKKAKTISNLDYTQLSLFSENTSTIIHEKAINYAKKHDIKLMLTSSALNDQATEIHSTQSYQQAIMGILYQQQDNSLYKIIILCNPNTEVKNIFALIENNKDFSQLKFMLGNHSVETHNIAKSQLHEYISSLYLHLCQ